MGSGLMTDIAAKQEWCGFCGKNNKEIARLIDGPTTAICNECIDLLHGMLHDPPRTGPSLMELRQQRKAVLAGKQTKP
jgi:ATP-dependent protease Clp ATPase subunit